MAFIFNNSRNHGDLSNRPTGFHGESGRARTGGHITVDFWTRKTHYATHHIYATDAAYGRESRFGRR
jgi:hypothetical protein